MISIILKIPGGWILRSNYERFNFGKYLEDIRNKHGVSVEALSAGLCDRSLISKIESGDRYSSMLLRDRLIDRIGATSEEYEKYVKIDEFKRWRYRTEIIRDIEEKRYADAEDKLEGYFKSINDGDALEEQFVYDMKAMLARLEGRKDADIFAEKALEKTVSLDADGFVVMQRLAPREINLVIEYSAGIGRTKRLEQLRRLIRYSDENDIDVRNLVLFYPKLVYVYASEYIKDYTNDPEWLSQTLKKVCKAERYLFVTNRLFYALELTEVKDAILNCILKLKDCENAIGYEQFLENKTRNEDEHNLWTGLEKAYRVDMRTRDWCYLYHEEGVKCVGDVIRRRRHTLGMSKEELCRDICSFDTLDRIERLKMNPQPKRMMELLTRLKLSGEYQKTLVSVTNAEAKKIEENIAIYTNAREYDKALIEMASLKKINKSTTAEDDQFFLMNETMIKYRKREIPAGECEQLLDRALGFTLPAYDISGDFYMTRLELTCLYNRIIIRKDVNDDKLMRFVENMCDPQHLNDDTRDTRILELFLFAEMRIREAAGDWKGAERYGKILVLLELRCKRSAMLYSVFNERILIYDKRIEQGEDVPEKDIRNNDLLVATFRKREKANKQ